MGSKLKTKIGNVIIGGGEKIAIQSMTNTKTVEVEATVAQITALVKEGCHIVRLAIPDMDSVKAFSEIRAALPNVPLVCDIHFDYKLAIASLENGADKVRINPGNIGDMDRVRAVVEAAKAKNAAIRIGVNSGSLRKEELERYGKVTPEGLSDSARYFTEEVAALGFTNMVVSIKASDVRACIEANRLFAKHSDFPIHLGITEAGTVFSGTVKSAVGLGILLYDGIGDTLRVSLTGDPCSEIAPAREILKSLDLMEGPTIISCPTCARTGIDLIGLADSVGEMVKSIDKNIKIAVMGCVVNGPGEAREADIGVAGGDGVGLIFTKGETLRKVPENEILSALKEEIDKL